MIWPVRGVRIRLGFGVGFGKQLVQCGQHGTVSGVGLLADESTDCLIGGADLPAHILDARINAFEFSTNLTEQRARLTVQIWVFGDVTYGIVDFLTSFVSDDHLEGVLEASAAIGFTERFTVFVMIGGKDVFHAHGTRLHAPAQRVAVVTFGERQFT